jgi:hypothetical protein
MNAGSDLIEILVGDRDKGKVEEDPENNRDRTADCDFLPADLLAFSRELFHRCFIGCA